MKRNRKKHAYVTFLMRNDSFLPGALVLADSLRRHQTKHDIVCLVTSDVSALAIDCLQMVYDHVVIVDEITVKHRNTTGRQDRSSLFTRIQSLRLGECGDLGFNYKKIVVLDADMMMLKNIDELFDINTPAGIINESKHHFLADSPNLTNGLSNWHLVYNKICPHGQIVPRQLTDRVWDDANNLGINACLWVLQPDYYEYKRVVKLLTSDEIVKKIQRFNWPEMQLMTYLWSGKWHSVDYRYAAFNAQPNLASVYSTHFAGLKPWTERRVKDIKHYFKYEDYQLWYVKFYLMAKYTYPSLQKHPKIRRVIKLYETLFD